MKKIIFVTASALECGGETEFCGLPIYEVGIGKINAAMNLTEIICREKPEVVVNFGSCGNLRDYKVGEVLEVGMVSNDIDTSPFLPYGCSSESQGLIILSESEVRCFSTDTVYDKSRKDYTGPYMAQINMFADIVDMECYALASVCQKFDVQFAAYKWISDDGDISNWAENAAAGYENFKQLWLG